MQWLNGTTIDFDLCTLFTDAVVSALGSAASKYRRAAIGNATGWLRWRWST